MPKSTRPAGSGQLRPHSRSSSTSKLGANLQFTQKDPQQPKHPDKPKKAIYPHETHPVKAAPPFVRVNSGQRVHSREQLALATKRQAQPPPKPANGKGFTIASPSEDGEDDADWESSESGAATPNHQDSDSSDTASETDAPDQALLNNVQPPSQPQLRPAQPQQPPRADAMLTRVQTARPSDFETMQRLDRSSPKPPTPPRQQTQPQPQPQPLPPMVLQPPRSEPDPRREAMTEPSQLRQSPRPKRHSRPPSTHSMHSKTDHALRPHPLIRGLSHGHVNTVPKPSPLAPLTVMPNAALPEISTSPPSSIDGTRHHLSSSPTSLRTSSGSPISTDLPHLPFPLDRRTSFSSARSVNTVPVHSTIIREAPWTHDRTRTLSAMSTSSSSAALSSLTHLPAVTRPPSPQTIAFFPPVNPHANIEGIHPLLPVPYLHNHLTVLSRRTPIRESFDRVFRAKNAR
ncbi:hypothetical protein GALMADRAFT_280059 [Galerina marginata CBS 339.88]|uniref:Uncharacterized protein n=1 Tax=Galerina marginata (strain CBS 339.88) TaxID=685588 RepID=A0A067SWM8_GALM3|nr:hypothetical protein GALMADRAFT_280059 [Galerina marginata CBS 339.88]